MNFPWVLLGLLTLLRLLIAGLGHFGETESYLILCSRHLDWGFVEGPAGIPALMRLCGVLSEQPFMIRCLSPIMLLGASWILWQWATALSDKKTAFWTVVIFNMLPLSNAAGLVMDGTMLVASCWLAALWIAWKLVSKRLGEQSPFFLWIMLGGVLAVGTQVTCQIGCLFPLVMIASLNCFYRHDVDEKRETLIFSTRSKAAGIGIAAVLLVLSWLPFLAWNQQYDWLPFQNVTWDSFWSWPPLPDHYFQELPQAWFFLALAPLLIVMACCCWGVWDFENPFFVIVALPFFLCLNELGHGKAPFAFILVVTASLLPVAVDCFRETQKRKILGFVFLFIFSGASALLLLGKISLSTAQESPWNFSSASGITGVEAVAQELTKLRAEHVDSSGRPPFLVAETPGLAAILGALLPITYPERTGAPAVFVAESPAITSQFQLWPHYADATAENTTPDPLYTEEKAVSPFLGHDAFYITTETLEEIPQTITGAFAAVVLLNVTPSITKNSKPEMLNIYLCQGYHMLSL